MNASHEYAEIQRQFHIERPDYGISGARYADHILSLAEKLKTRDLLDYGCGKATLQKSIPYPIQNYDPFVQEYNRPPNPADIVICTDVMEHIEPEYITRVLNEIRTLTKKLAFFQIATRPASKFLPDGRNAHLIQEGINWWLAQLMPFFEVRQLQDMGGGFLMIGTPQAEPEQS